MKLVNYFSLNVRFVNYFSLNVHVRFEPNTPVSSIELVQSSRRNGTHRCIEKIVRARLAAQRRCDLWCQKENSLNASPQLFGTSVSVAETQICT